MNAPVIATLDLPATPAMPRALFINLGFLTGWLIAMVSVGGKVITSASAQSQSAEIDEGGPSGPFMLLDRTRFNLTSEEVTKIRAFLAQFPTAAPIGPEPAKVASHAVDPPDSAPGAQLSPAESGGGALESP